MVVGDSHTIGSEVSSEATFAQVLENRLRASGTAAGALNAGVSGYSRSHFHWIRSPTASRERLWRTAPSGSAPIRRRIQLTPPFDAVSCTFRRGLSLRGP